MKHGKPSPPEERKGPDDKPGLHPRNRHRRGYDFERLLTRAPALAAFIQLNPAGEKSIDYADPAAVRALNRALLCVDYRLEYWDLPAGQLCPPVPGRADYVHHLADLLAGESAAPRGSEIAVLDIGVGANCIYPLIGAVEYGWRFVGSDIDARAVKWASDLAVRNVATRDRVEIRLQPSRSKIFAGVIKPGESFAATMCNPPFHASAVEAAAGNQRKRRNLGQGKGPALNFGGSAAELWCEGGEEVFVRRMIFESATMPGLARWFTTLVAGRDHLPAIEHALRRVKPAEVKIIPMAQGQKRSRIVAWRM